jgi:hypothetical protein
MMKLERWYRTRYFGVSVLVEVLITRKHHIIQYLYRRRRGVRAVCYH